MSSAVLSEASEVECFEVRVGDVVACEATLRAEELHGFIAQADQWAAEEAKPEKCGEGDSYASLKRLIAAPPAQRHLLVVRDSSSVLASSTGEQRRVRAVASVELGSRVRLCLCSEDDEAVITTVISWCLSSLAPVSSLLFESLPQHLVPMVSRQLDSMGPVWTEPCVVMGLSELDTKGTACHAVQAKIGAEVRGLVASDAELCNSKWAYRSAHSEASIRRLIEEKESSGVVKAGGLAAWALTGEDGSICKVHTREEYRRQSLGTVAVADLALRHLEAGRRPFCHITVANEASIGMFQRIGFEHRGLVSWLGWSPHSSAL
jgi:ribosomal protein S18 acetylase RimI-like enzyme